MGFLRNFGVRSACLAVALSALVGVASASDIKVHVPVAAEWGGQMLPAGDYKFSFNRSSPFARLSGNGKGATILVTAVATQTFGEHGFLRITDVHGTPTVTAFGSETEGLRYDFALPKSSARTRRTPAEEVAQGY